MVRVADSMALVVGLEKAETGRGTVYWSHIAASNCPWLQVGPTPHGSLDEAIDFLVEQFRECLKYLARFLDALQTEEIERARRELGELRARARARIEADE